MFNYEYVAPEEMTPQTTLLEPGDAHFVIDRWYETKKDGSDLRTREGDKMLGLQLMVTDSKGEISAVYDNLIANTKNAWKIKQLLDCVGKPELYTKRAELNPNDLLKLQGRATIKTQISPGYPDKSVINRYLPYDDSIKGKLSFKMEGNKEDDDDDVPF